MCLLPRWIVLAHWARLHTINFYTRMPAPHYVHYVHMHVWQLMYSRVMDMYMHIAHVCILDYVIPTMRRGKLSLFEMQASPYWAHQQLQSCHIIKACTEAWFEERHQEHVILHCMVIRMEAYSMVSERMGGELSSSRGLWATMHAQKLFCEWEETLHQMYEEASGAASTYIQQWRIFSQTRSRWQ